MKKEDAQQDVADEGVKDPPPRGFRQWIRNEVSLRGTEIPFLIFTTFLVTFVAVRTYVWLFNIPESTHLQTTFFGYRIHHYWWGIILLCIAGWLAIMHKGKNLDRTAAIMYGIGLGLILDEAGLLLTELTNYYSMSTYSIILSVILLFLTIIFFPLFWVAVKKEVGKRRDQVKKFSGDVVDDIEDGGRWMKDKMKGTKPKGSNEHPDEYKSDKGID